MAPIGSASSGSGATTPATMSHGRGIGPPASIVAAPRGRTVLSTFSSSCHFSPFRRWVQRHFDNAAWISASRLTTAFGVSRPPSYALPSWGCVSSRRCSAGSVGPFPLASGLQRGPLPFGSEEPDLFRGHLLRIPFSSAPGWIHQGSFSLDFRHWLSFAGRTWLVTSQLRPAARYALAPSSRYWRPSRLYLP